ncbi:MAG: hypothetical protein CVU52_02145 [Deltaproteobacteria bacterium HGW-Deltaproteobacteria-10]|nr:MAG: hypothetical protein CVU52_02145 [Deltaproteobacteria bacterium HGW-Deltaproteobacteria-10]
MKKNLARNSLIIIMLGVLSACGFKGNPAPYPAMSDSKPAIQKMEAISSGEAIVLQWDFQDKKGLISYIDIERSETGTPGNECKGCPRTYTKIGRISVKSSRPADKEQRTLSFTDTNAIKEKIYNYRLLLCEENGNCSESSTVDINFK